MNNSKDFSELLSSQKFDTNLRNIKSDNEIKALKSKDKNIVNDLPRISKHDFFKTLLSTYDSLELWSNVEEWMLITLFKKYKTNFKLYAKVYKNREWKEIKMYFYALLKYTAYEWKYSTDHWIGPLNIYWIEQSDLYVENPNSISEEDLLKYILPCWSLIDYNPKMNYIELYRQTKIEPDISKTLNGSAALMEDWQKLKLMKLYNNNFEISEAPHFSQSFMNEKYSLCFNMKKCTNSSQ